MVDRRIFAGLGVFGAAIVLAAGLALFAPAQMPPPGWAPGGGGGGSGSGTVSSGTATQVAKYTAETTVGSQSTATFQANGQLYVQGSAANDAMIFGNSSAANGSGIWGRNSASGGQGLVGEATHTGAFPLTVRAPSGQTADLTRWLVNGSPVASVDAAGIGDFSGVSVGGTPIGRWNEPVAFSSLGTCDGSADKMFQPFTDSWFDYAFCNGSAWSYYHDGEVHSPASLQTLEWGDNQETATVTSAGGSYILEDDGTGTSANDIRLYKKTVPSAPYTVEIGFYSNFVFQNFWTCGLGLWNSTSDDYIGIGFGVETTSVVRSTKYSDHNTFSANYYLFQPAQFQSFWVLKVEDNNTNRIVSISSDEGKTFRQIHSESRTDFITPTDIGIMLNPITIGNTEQGLCEFVYWDES